MQGEERRTAIGEESIQVQEAASSAAMLTVRVHAPDIGMQLSQVLMPSGLLKFCIRSQSFAAAQR